MASIRQITIQLHRAFNIFNEKKFNGECPKCVITIQPEGRKQGILGWCTVGQVWNEDNGKKQKAYWEINVVAEYLNRPYKEVLATVLHEMVHLDYLNKGIKDTSGYGYHNKTFRAGAEAVGLEVEKSERYGHAHTKMTEELSKEVEGWGFTQGSFTLARNHMLTLGGGEDKGGKKGGGTAGGHQGGKQKTKMLKWSCGCTNVRCAVELSALCGKCGGEFKRQD